LIIYATIASSHSASTAGTKDKTLVVFKKAQSEIVPTSFVIVFAFTVYNHGLK